MGRWSHLEALERLELREEDRVRLPRQREGVEIWRERLELLGVEDRVLLKTYWEGQSSFDEIARLLGLSRSTVCRRIHRMLRRLADETYDRCQQGPFGEAELAVIRDHFLRGHSLRRVCRDHDLGYCRARGIVQRARAFVRTTKTG